MTKDEKKNKDHDGKQTESTQEEQLMDEQYEFGLNEDVREQMEKDDRADRKEPEDKADEDDTVVDE